MHAVGPIQVLSRPLGSVQNAGAGGRADRHRVRLARPPEALCWGGTREQIAVTDGVGTRVMFENDRARIRVQRLAPGDARVDPRLENVGAKAHRNLPSELLR